MMIAKTVIASTLLATGIAPVAAQTTHFVTIRNEVVVDRPVDQVWKRIGDYCAIAEWMKVSCTYLSGNGDVGTVRQLMGGSTTEPMVAKTAHSYTYWQNKGNMAIASFHGTLAAEPDGPGRSRLSYTLFYDASALPSDAVRSSEHERLNKRFAELLGVMKSLAETSKQP